MNAVGGPGERLGRSNHARAHRILFDVPQTGEPIAFVVNREAAIAAVPQRADAVVAAVEVVDIAPSELLDGGWQRSRVRRSHYQMRVIVHQRVAVNGKAMLLRRPPKERNEDLAIRVVADDRAAVDASLDHMNADVGDEDP